MAGRHSDVFLSGRSLGRPHPPADSGPTANGGWSFRRPVTWTLGIVHVVLTMRVPALAVLVKSVSTHENGGFTSWSGPFGLALGFDEWPLTPPPALRDT